MKKDVVYVDRYGVRQGTKCPNCGDGETIITKSTWFGLGPDKLHCLYCLHTWPHDILEEDRPGSFIE